MQFIDITNRRWHPDCLGCAIGDSTVKPPGGLIAENDSSYLHQDPEIPLEAFLVIGIKRHVQSLADFTIEEHGNVSSLLRIGRRLMSLVPEILGVTIIQKEKSPHFHMWMFPWHEWMVGKYGRESLDHIRAIMERDNN